MIVKEKNLFSVIVPIYNVEEYLKTTLNSVLNQTFSDFELILVDDGSSDRSSQICDDYKNTDERIKVIHKSNGGIVSARKAGAEIATGKYVVCLDGDDWLRDNALEKIASVIENNNGIDIVCFGLTWTDGIKEHTNNNPYRSGYYSRNEIVSNIFPILIQGENASYFAPSLCGKAIKLELYKTYQMKVSERIIIGEDGVCTIPCVYNSSSIFVMDDYLYYYRVNFSSVTKSKRELDWNIPIFNANQIKESVDLEKYDFKIQLYRKMVHDLYYVIRSRFNSDKSFWTIRNDILRELKNPILQEAIKSAKFKGSLKASCLLLLFKARIFLPFKLMGYIRR